MNRKMLRQAQQLQKQMLEVQQELESATVEATAGGGVVKAVVSGKMKVESLTIDPEAVSPDDVEMLQDLVQAAVNEGLDKAQEMASSKMGALTGGMNIPGLDVEDRGLPRERGEVWRDLESHRPSRGPQYPRPPSVLCGPTRSSRIGSSHARTAR